MAYGKQTWADGAPGKTPLNAAALQHIEDGIAAAHSVDNPVSAPANATVGVASHGPIYPTLPRLSRPTGPRAVVSTFQPGHGWTLNAGTAVLADDAVTFARQNQSLRITTLGDGAANRVRSGVLAPVLDMSAGVLAVELEVDDPTTITTAGVQLAVTSDNFVGNYVVGYVLANQSLPETHAGNFYTLYVSRADLLGQTTGSGGVQTGKVDWTAINGVQVTVIDGGVPAVVRLQSVSVVPEPASGCVVFCFDDGWLSQAVNCAPYLDKYGFAAVAFIIRDLLTAADGGSQQYMSLPQVRRLHDAHGWDISCHSDAIADHNLALGHQSLSLADFETECIRMKAFLAQNGLTRGSDFYAWPKGYYDPAHLAVAERYFSGIRAFTTGSYGVWNDVYPLGDPMQMRGLAVTGGAAPDSAATVNAAIDSAMAARKVVLVTFHNPTTTVDGASTTYPLANFKAIVDHVAAAGFPVRTLSQLFKDGVPAAASAPSTPGVAKPTDFGLTGWSMDPVLATSGIALPAGAAFGARVYDTPNALRASVQFQVSTAGVAVANAYVCVYSSAGALLAQSANLATTFQSTGVKRVPLSYTVPADGVVLITVQVQSATTLPAITGIATGSSMNFSFPGAGRNARSFTSGSALAAPLAALTPTTLTPVNSILFLASGM